MLSWLQQCIRTPVSSVTTNIPNDPSKVGAHGPFSAKLSLMSSDYTPLKILSATASAGLLTEGWNLAALTEDRDSNRQFSLFVPFAYPFSAPPVVQAGLTGFDIDQGTSARLTVNVVNITAEGFEIVLTTWLDTLVYATEVSWLAIGP
jgi:hypothetical protein